MMPTDRLAPVLDESLTPLLLWNETVPCVGGAALACPQCAGPNLHLDTIHFAVPTDNHYTPTVGLSIAADNGAITGGDEARRLHASQNRGPMLSIAYWCEDGCHGRIDLRSHKGHLFASLHNEMPVQPDPLNPAAASRGRTQETTHGAK